MTKETFDPAQWMSFREAADELGVLFQQVYQRYAQGKLTVTTMFGKKLVLRSDIAKWKVAREEYFSKTKK